MNINVTIALGTGEFAGDLAGNATEIAEKILEAAGGDPSKDTCNVSISDYGMAGGPPPSITEPPPVTPTSESVNSTFATNNQTPPLDKQTRTNATAFSSVTAIYVDNQSTEGDDLATKLLALGIGDTVELRGVSDTSRYGTFTLSAAPIDQTDFVELPVSFVEAGNPLTNGACVITIPVK